MTNFFFINLVKFLILEFNLPVVEFITDSLNCLLLKGAENKNFKIQIKIFH